MRALTVMPGVAGSARLDELPNPEAGPDEILVAGLALGVCGTDREIVGGHYGWAPPGRERLVLGHESLGRVLGAPTGSGFSAGDLVVGIVRRPDPEPCAACALGQWDMCRNGRYTEHGIKALDGFAAERCVLPVDATVGAPAALGELAGTARTGQRRGEGVGSHRPHRPARRLVPTTRARHRRRPHRPDRSAEPVQ